MPNTKTFLIQDIYNAGDKIGLLAPSKQPLFSRIKNTFNKPALYKPLKLGISNRNRRERENQLSDLAARLRNIT